MNYRLTRKRIKRGGVGKKTKNEVDNMVRKKTKNEVDNMVRKAKARMAKKSNKKTNSKLKKNSSKSHKPNIINAHIKQLMDRAAKGEFKTTKKTGKDMAAAIKAKAAKKSKSVTRTFIHKTKPKSKKGGWCVTKK